MFFNTYYKPIKMEIKSILITLWKKQGLSSEQIKERAEQLGYTLPPEYNIVTQEVRNPRKAGSIKNSPTITFRPTPENDIYIKNIKKGDKSSFINRAIKFLIEHKKSKWN
jgi:ribosomal protein S16